MSSERDDDKTVITDNNIPVNSAGDPITYMGNPATIPGLLYQIEEWSAETQRFHLPSGWPHHVPRGGVRKHRARH